MSSYRLEHAYKLAISTPLPSCRRDVHFREPDPARNHIRLGFAAIGTERIGPGIARLAEALAAVRAY